jgi:hypothetical protein
MNLIYLSGPMTGLPELNFPAFNAAAAKLRAAGHGVVNPAEINVENNADWHACMRADIRALCDCDALALLPGWQHSNGAHLELHIAHRLGLRIGTVEEFGAVTTAIDAALNLWPRDCRLCAHFTTKAGGCTSVVQCVDSAQFKTTTPRQYWSGKPAGATAIPPAPAHAPPAPPPRRAR